jgi:hypothetical protein
MPLASSSRNDPRLGGEGGRRAWPWIRSAALLVAGALIIFPGGIGLGLSFSLAPDSTRFATFIWVGIAANLTIGLALGLLRTKPLFYAFSAPAFLMIAITLVRSVWFAW